MGGGNGIKGMGKMSSRRLLLVNSRLGAVGKGGGGGVGRESSVQNSLALYWFKAWGSLLPSKSKE